MTTFRQRGMLASAACLFSLFALSAHAQTDAVAAADTDSPAAAPQTGSGPMLVEKVRSGFLIAPDFKVTRFDGETSTLAGVYGGWLADQTFLLGAGGYWLTDRSRTHNMMYGGFVVGWLSHADRRVGYEVKGLIGAGEADLGFDVTLLQPLVPVRLPIRITPTIRIRDDFFITEPQADVLVHLGKQFRLTGGVGYRLIGGARGLEQRLRGATGSVALQIGGGS